MIDPRLRFRHLRCFQETARLGSLSAAAEALHVSQPAASKTIKDLEDILGCALFDRSGRRLTLTQAGRVFQQHVGAGLIALKQAQDLVRGAPAQVARVLVGVLPSAASALMPRAALAFQSALPDCLLRVTTGPNWLLMSQLREGALDLVVGRMAAAKVMEGLTFQPLYSEPIVGVVRRGHPLAGMARPQEHLRDHPLILPPPGAVISDLVRSYLARQGVPPGSHRVETVSLAFGRSLVQGSDAVWFISRGVIAPDLTAGALAALDLGEDLAGAPVGISMRQDGPPRPELAALLAALKTAAR